jgi:hypothetical protein
MNGIGSFMGFVEVRIARLSFTQMGSEGKIARDESPEQRLYAMFVLLLWNVVGTLLTLKNLTGSGVA